MKCPLCRARHELQEVKTGLLVMRNKLDRLTDQLAKLEPHVDLVVAMRMAMEVADSNDRTFLKSVLYRYRDDKSTLSMKPIHTRPNQPVNGFLVTVRHADSEAHICTSPGGVALAGYYDEAVRTGGVATAIAVLIKAVNQSLAIEAGP